MTYRKKLLTIFIMCFSVWILFLIQLNPNNIPLLFGIGQITPVSPIYNLKIAREFLQSKFVFGNDDLSYWYFNLARKRLDETEILKKYHLYSIADQQKKLATQYNELGYKHLEPLINVIDTNNLQEMYLSNKQRISN